MPDSRDQNEAVSAFYRYDPGMGAAVLFTLRFIGTIGYHIFQMFKSRMSFFVAGDVPSFLLQGAGGSIQSSGNLESMKNGEHIIVVGLFVQIFFFGFFTITASHFYWKIKKYPIPRSCTPDIPWSKHLHVLHLASFLIMVRPISRLTEYLQGNNGYLCHHEIYLYISDALLMFITMVTFNVVHPQEVGRLLSYTSD
ncbi:RTA1 like protein-domain-containing protein [Aspergillus navahoensis]